MVENDTAMRRLVSLILLLCLVGPWHVALACDAPCRESGDACVDRCACCGDGCECSSDANPSSDHESQPAAPSTGLDRIAAHFLPDRVTAVVAGSEAWWNEGSRPSTRTVSRHACGRTVLLRTGHLLH